MERERFFITVESALRGGVDAVLVREKEMDSARLLAFCSRLRDLTREYDARLLVHTQADVAKAVGADGVHVAGKDIGEIPAIRHWLDDTAITISASCHDAVELQRAADAGADFALLSPVFPTTSHPGALHLGAKHFCTLADVAPLPVAALGGITPENRSELVGYPVAVFSAIMDVDEPELITRRLNAGSVCP